jgi:hypothetical protein
MRARVYQWVREAAEAVTWRPTVREPEPHMYLIRDLDPDRWALIVRAWELYAEPGDYHGHPFRYLRPGDRYRYWAMPRYGVLNRQEDEEPHGG